MGKGVCALLKTTTMQKRKFCIISLVPLFCLLPVFKAVFLLYFFFFWTKKGKTKQKCRLFSHNYQAWLEKTQHSTGITGSKMTLNCVTNKATLLL